MTMRTHCGELWEHLTLPNIGNSTIQLQISTQCTTIGPRNPPVRPGMPQETFLFLASIYHKHNCLQLKHFQAKI